MGRGEEAEPCRNSMHLKIISWNVWGINDLDKRKVITTFFRRWKPHVVCLQETKMGIIDIRVINCIGGGNWFDWDFLGAEGLAGGILVMWDKRVITKMDVLIGACSVSCLLKTVENDKLWVISGDRRLLLWNELKMVRSRWSVPWCIGCNFNSVRNPRERSGSRGFTTATRDFNEFINEQELMELMDWNLSGGDYTWFRHEGRNQFSRIDRFCTSADLPVVLANLFSIVSRGLYRIMFPYSLIEVELRKVRLLLGLRTCGSRRRDLRTGLG